MDNRAVYDMYFAEPLPEWAFAERAMSPEERSFYGEVCREICEAPSQGEAKELAGLAG